MSIKFIPFDTEISLKGQKAWEREVIVKLECLEVAITKLEKQLEFVTEEKVEIDSGDSI